MAACCWRMRLMVPIRIHITKKQNSSLFDRNRCGCFKMVGQCQDYGLAFFPIKRRVSYPAAYVFNLFPEKFEDTTRVKIPHLCIKETWLILFATRSLLLAEESQGMDLSGVDKNQGALQVDPVGEAQGIPKLPVLLNFFFAWQIKNSYPLILRYE